MENKNIVAERIDEKQRIYPKRPYEDVSKALDEIERILSGEESILSLSETEKEELLKWEDDLGAEVEELYENKARACHLNIDFLHSEDGRKKWFELTGVQLPESRNDIEVFVYINSRLLADEKKNKEVISFRAASDEYVDTRMAQQLADAALDGIDAGRMDNLVDRINLILDDQLLVEKMEGLENLRRTINQQIQLLKEYSEPLEIAKTEILKLYRKRVNEILANVYQSVYKIFTKEEQVGVENLSQWEKKAIKHVKKGRKRAKSYAMLDKFLYGTGDKKSEGNYEQITEEVSDKISVVGNIEQEPHGMRVVEDKGLDYDKLLNEKVFTSDDRAAWGREVLEAYGLLSEADENFYLDNPNERAPDGLWQYVPREDSKNKAVNSRVQCIKDPKKKKENLVGALVVTLAHEIEGHVLQHENKKKIPLRIFQKTGADRTGLMAEAGALYAEKKVLREALGLEKTRKTAYVKAMNRKLAGGSYIDSLNAICASVISKTKAKYNLDDDVEREECRNKIREKIEKLIPTVRRVFNKGALLDNDKFVTHSKDTVYVEQELLMDELERWGLTRLAFVGGLNVYNIMVLAKLGLIDLDDIKEPRYECMKIWERLKPQYLRADSTI